MQASSNETANSPPVNNQGTALQQAALETDSLLPLYGSSELNLQVPYTRPFHPTKLFHDHPTGFTIFPVGKAGNNLPDHAPKAGRGRPSAEGRKVAISVSPVLVLRAAHGPAQMATPAISPRCTPENWSSIRV